MRRMDRRGKEEDRNGKRRKVKNRVEGKVTGSDGTLGKECKKHESDSAKEKKIYALTFKILNTQNLQENTGKTKSNRRRRH